MGYEVGGFIGFLVFLLDIWAIIKIASSSASTTKKFIWIAVVLLLPIVGFVAWFLIGPK